MHKGEHLVNWSYSLTRCIGRRALLSYSI